MLQDDQTYTKVNKESTKKITSKLKIFYKVETSKLHIIRLL